MPPAISGSGGHDALFRVACVLTNGFALSDEQAWSILQEYNARCQPPWSQRELPHKLSEVRKVSHLKSLGHLLSERGEITPQSSSPPRVPRQDYVARHCRGDPGPLTANEQPLVADEPRLAAPPPNWATYTGMAQLAAPMTRTRGYLPRSFTPNSANPHGHGTAVRCSAKAGVLPRVTRFKKRILPRSRSPFFLLN